jgi:hypothetical protein
MTKGSIHDFHYHRDAIRRSTADEGYHAVDRPRAIGGKLYGPATSVKLGYEGIDDDTPRGTGLLLMDIDGVGLSKAMPPLMMRELAGQLVKIADMIDAAAAKATDAAIARARSAGK